MGAVDTTVRAAVTGLETATIAGRDCRLGVVLGSVVQRCLLVVDGVLPAAVLQVCRRARSLLLLTGVRMQ